MKKAIIEEIGILAEAAFNSDKYGMPKKAVKENRRAIILTKRFLKVLEDNDAVFEAHVFLMGDSSITRKPKKK